MLQLKNVLKHVQLIEEESIPKNIVAIGRTVVIQEVDTDFEETYMIVGSMESDPDGGKISNESPMGQALLGKKVGQEATVETPGGEIAFEIVRVQV